MSKRVKKVEVSKCRDYVLDESSSEYTRRDVLLYAIGVGLSINPLDSKELRYTFEGSDGFCPLPSFGVVLPKMDRIFESLQSCPGLPPFNPMMLLHGEQRIQLFSHPLPDEAELLHVSRIVDVVDKRSAALVICETETRLRASNEVLCKNEARLFIRGIGGFSSGNPAASPSTSTTPTTVKATSSSSSPIAQRKAASGRDTFPLPSPLSRAPDATTTRSTNKNQALIYRLSGDFNPLHADPSFSSLGGFDVPILHGLCTFGIGAYACIKEVCGNDVENVVAIGGRFTSPVYPGDSLKINIWKEINQHDQDIVFECVNLRTNKKALSNGIIKMRNNSNGSDGNNIPRSAL